MNIINLIKQYFDTKYFAIIKKLEKIEKQIEDLDKKNDYLFFANRFFIGMNKDDVFLSLPPATGELRRIQLAENGILKRLKIICDKLGISFFLLFGTALGAVRHKGFIPWDDDLDIGMMFRDFVLLEEYLKQDDVLEIHYTYLIYGTSIVKVKYKGLSNIFVDVFLFDYIDATDDEVFDKVRIVEEKTNIYREVIRSYFRVRKDLHEYLKPVYIEELDIIARMKLKELSEGLDFYGVRNGGFIIRAISNYRSNWVYKTTELMPIIKNRLEFEGYLYDSLGNNEELLKLDFGNYMTLPSSITEYHRKEFDDRLIIELDIIEKRNNRL